MKRLTVYNLTKFKAPETCKECHTAGSVERIANNNDRYELFHFKKWNQHRTLIDGKWKKIDSVATIVHQCNNCDMREVKWRHVKRVNEKRTVASRILDLITI